MEIKGDEDCQLVLYKIISQLLSGECERDILRVGEILNEYSECFGEKRQDILSLLSDMVIHVKCEGEVRGFLNKLREKLYDKKLRDEATLILRELCSREILDHLKGWGEDLEPSVRIAYLKCLLKLFDRGEVGVDYLVPLAEDPSPKVRLALVSSLSIYAEREEVRKLFIEMLRRESRGEIRNLILEAISPKSRLRAPGNSDEKILNKIIKKLKKNT
ncbi:MAG: HEAT repeat domain-containing protein [Candidatus Korarchaeum sp.]|jgi:HEAT repeat protein|nr:HEAT repeat domain-containing protein [Candidatus Korarchaeum sp.]